MRYIGTVLLAFLTLAAAPSFAGWHTGNAGDVFAAEFILTGRDLVQRLRFAGIERLPSGLSVDRLSRKIDGVTVTSEKNVWNLDPKDGKYYEVNAVNYPLLDKVVVNQTRWLSLREAVNTRMRSMVVAHEYFLMLNVDDAEFKESSQLVDLLGVENYSPNIFWNPINPVNILEARIEGATNGCSLHTQEFDTNVTGEQKEMRAEGSCNPKTYRRVVVTKTSSITPPSTGVRGLFHRYKVEIFDQSNQSLGELVFEPEWGRCLQPDSRVCRFSGKITMSGVELSFGYLKNYKELL